MRKILTQKFFSRPTLTVARALIGKFLVRRIGSKEHAAMITETEAYHGFEDKASHAHRGRTPRNAPMFEGGGRWYVYFTYGMHWMLNAVTGLKDYPAAVLIRGIEGASGPARLTKALKIDGALSGKSISRVSGLWIENRGVKIPTRKIAVGPRIGVAYAAEWAEKPYRFYIKR